jgi:hypothetical protein
MGSRLKTFDISELGIATMPERDSNKEALEPVEKETESEPVRTPIGLGKRNWTRNKMNQH